jgi:uncharacterized protein
MTAEPALYSGTVVHKRMRPRRHQLRYRCYWFLLDLAKLDDTARRLRFFSLHRFNLFSFRTEDYGAGTAVPLRLQAEHHLAKAGIDIEGGRVLLLTMPRVLGYAFNPLSVYYCFTRDGALAALIYEVHNTFGQRHSYLIPVSTASQPVQQTCDKTFYVSPFLDMALSYGFTVAAPGDKVSVAIRASDRDGLVLSASLAGARQDLTDKALLKAFVTHPLLTVTVIAAIHWEAFRLWWKGNPLVTRPSPPVDPVTIVSTPAPTPSSILANLKMSHEH